MGRKAIPTAELERRGSWRAKTRPDEPMPSGAVLEPPEWIGTYGLEMWQGHVDELNRLGLVKCLDVQAFAMACRAYQDYREATAIVDAEGIIAETVRGVQANPAVGVADKAWARCVKLMREFGMTPASRPGLKGETPKQDDGKGRFFKVVG